MSYFDKISCYVYKKISLNSPSRVIDNMCNSVFLVSLFGSKKMSAGGRGHGTVRSPLGTPLLIGMEDILLICMEI